MSPCFCGQSTTKVRLHSGAETVSSVSGAGKTKQPHEKSERGLLAYTTNKNKLKMH